MIFIPVPVPGLLSPQEFLYLYMKMASWFCVWRVVVLSLFSEKSRSKKREKKNNVEKSFVFGGGECCEGGGC